LKELSLDNERLKEDIGEAMIQTVHNLKIKLQGGLFNVYHSLLKKSINVLDNNFSTVLSYTKQHF